MESSEVEHAIEVARGDARSDVPLTRMSAGVRLAQWAGREDVDRVLIQLILDPENTNVTLQTAEALLNRSDEVGVRALAGGAVGASYEQVEWIYAAVLNYLSDVTRINSSIDLCRALMDDSDRAIRGGAELLLDMGVSVKNIVSGSDPKKNRAQ